jgi:hypothetical protein
MVKHQNPEKFNAFAHNGCGQLPRRCLGLAVIDMFLDPGDWYAEILALPSCELRTSNGFGRGAPLISSDDPPAIVRRCSLKSSRRIAASCSRLVGCVIHQRLSACLAIDLPQQPTSRLPQAQPSKAGQ